MAYSNSRVSVAKYFTHDNLDKKYYIQTRGAPTDLSSCTELCCRRHVSCSSIPPLAEV